MNSFDKLIGPFLIVLFAGIGIYAYHSYRRRLTALWDELAKRFRAEPVKSPFDGLMLRTGSIPIRVSMKSTSELGGLDKTSYTTGLETSHPFLVIFFPRNSQTENLAKVLTKSLLGKFTAQQHNLKVDVAGDQGIDSAFIIISDGAVETAKLRSVFPYLRDRKLIYSIGTIKPPTEPGTRVLPILVGSPNLDFDPNVAQDRIKTLASFAEALTHHKFGRIVEPPLPVNSE